MKGKWLVNLVRETLKGGLSPVDAWRYLRLRFVPKPTHLQLSDVLFQNVDHILWSIIGEVYINREYTPAAYEIETNDVVVDIGAHKGVFTAYAATRTRAPVFAFEPDPANLVELKALVARHHWEHVRVKPLALAARANPSLTLYIASSSSRNSFRDQDPISGQPLTESFRVRAISLDEAIASLTQVDLLKLDCEGAEYEILTAASDTSLAKIRKLVMEYHQAPTESSQDQLISLLQRHFQEVRQVSKSGVELGYIYARKTR